MLKQLRRFLNRFPKFWQFIRKYKNFFHILLGVGILYVSHLTVFNLIEEDSIFRILVVGIMSGVLCGISEKVSEIIGKGNSTAQGAIKTFIPTILYIMAYLFNV